MPEDRIAMSQAERDRLKVMASVLGGDRTQAEAGRLLGRSVRQVRRILRRLQCEGDGGIIHKLRGRPSNNRKEAELRQAVLRICRQDYPDFGPTLAAEKLAQRGRVVCDETLRQWLMAEGLWKRKRKRDKHRRRRERRPCFGELVQADGSHHDWLEGRGPSMVLVAMIDDATSKVVAGFYPGETTEAYMDLLGRYLRKRGRMVALYVDRDSIFRAEDRDPCDPPARPDAVLTGPGATRHPVDPGLQPPGQGAGRTALPHRPGPPGQGTSSRRRHHDPAGQCGPDPDLPAAVQPTLHRQAGQSQ